MIVADILACCQKAGVDNEKSKGWYSKIGDAQVKDEVKKESEAMVERGLFGLPAW